MRYLRQILAALIGLGVIVLVFILVVRGFNSNSSTTTQKQIDILKYANTDAVASLYIDDPVVADQDHRTIKINVSQTAVSVDVIKGYGSNVIRHQDFPNNATSYAVFLQSLKNLNFTTGNQDPKLADERGYCSGGNRYIYQFAQEGNTLFRYWSTSCGEGTFKGNRGSVQNLFQQQIPSSVSGNLIGDANF